MSPSYTLSAHLGKQFYATWRQARQPSPEGSLSGSPPSASFMRPFSRSPSPPAAPRSERRSSTSSESDWSPSGRR